jgi:hypothetical protein
MDGRRAGTISIAIASVPSRAAQLPVPASIERGQLSAPPERGVPPTADTRGESRPAAPRRGSQGGGGLGAAVRAGRRARDPGARSEAAGGAWHRSHAGQGGALCSREVSSGPPRSPEMGRAPCGSGDPRDDPPDAVRPTPGLPPAPSTADNRCMSTPMVCRRTGTAPPAARAAGTGLQARPKRALSTHAAASAAHLLLPAGEGRADLLAALRSRAPSA